MTRYFISINLPDEIKSEIEKIYCLLPKFTGKKTEVENMHLTLKFLGEIDERKLEEVKDRLKRIKFDNFFIKFGEAGVFSPSFLRIIWIKIFGVEDLQKKIDESLEGLFPKEKRFMGHLTIGRIKKVGNKKEFLASMGKIKAKVGKFEVGSFELMNSVFHDSGPEYEVIEEFKLN